MDDFQDAVSFFQRAFTIVLALALGEAFKQFIADRADKPEDRTIHWDRLPSLLSFLFLMFPFFHGMSRYFFVTYIHTKTPPAHYGVNLMIDGVAFLAESAIFFFMSRTLSSGQWKRYYHFTLLLMAVDISWGLISLARGTQEGNIWIAYDAVLALVLIVVLLLYKKRWPTVQRSLCPPIIAACATFLTTTLTYIQLWNFYFP